ncbi:hypothetical protein [Nocardiopsis potens]|uniref:hypothetical protein n=1 Tax=Nocardiopsis potens TaxID=1246458 RepID=UPI000346FD87|nr:hypothetical protein [Nocardiopsis potens]
MPAYTGSGPYCYTHSLRMVIGPSAPPPGVVETLTGSPFGAQLIGGSLPLFDPFGWDPEIGLDTAVGLLGRSCERSAGGTAEEALERLRAACARGPVLVGPVDMGLLLYRPGTPAPGEGDHYAVVLAAGGGTVLLHDPHGHPYATLPARAFADAWRAESVDYTDEPYVMRAGFTEERAVDPAEALRASLPGAVRWLEGRGDRPVPRGTLGGAAALEALAAQAERGLDARVRGLLAEFGVRLGARRLADAAGSLSLIGLEKAAAAADEQARAVGALQYPLATGDDEELASLLRRAAPGYRRLRDALTAEA